MSDAAAVEYVAAAARSLSYAAIALVLGASTRGWLQPDDSIPRGVQRQLQWLGLAGCCLFLGAQSAKLWAQAAAFADPGTPITGHDLATFAFRTAWGRGWQLQNLLGLAALVTFAVSGHRRLLVTLRTVTAGGAAFCVPLTGHAAAHPDRLITALGIQGVHVIAAGLWLGTLATMVVVQVEGMGVWLRFSNLARACAALVIVTGLCRVLQTVDGAAALWQTGWGRTLMLKTLVVVSTGAVGLLNWRTRLPAALRQGHVTTALRRTVLLELALAGAVFVVTGWLSGLAPDVG